MHSLPLTLFIALRKSLLWDHHFPWLCILNQPYREGNFYTLGGLQKLIIIGPRIPKRWQWQGPLYLNDSTSLFCSVKIHSSTDPKPSEMRFSVAFEGVTDLSMTTVHNVLDLRSILPVFRPWTQLALLNHQEEKDYEPFKILYHYLETFLKVWIYTLKQYFSRWISFRLFWDL